MTINPPKTARGERGSYKTETPHRILDSAEKLFSERSYEAVTLREIADDAGVRVGQITYHFGQKHVVVRRCILRRADVLNQERRQLLTNYKQLVGEKNVQIEPLIRAYADPFMRKVIDGDQGWRFYTRFLGRVVWDANVGDVIIEAFNDVAGAYLESFHDALPTINENHAARAFQFFIVTLYNAAADDRRIEALSKGTSRSDDIQGYYDTIIPMIAGGFLRLAEDGKTSPARPVPA